jgi:type IV secretory pathway VirB4 component
MYSVFVIFSILLTVATLVFLFLWRREQDWWLPKISFERLSSIMPFAGIMKDSKTLVCNDGTLAQVLSITPVDYSILTKGAIRDIEKRRQRWLDKMAEHNAHIRIFTTRDKKECILDGEYPHPRLKEIHDKWMSNFDGVYHNRHYIVLAVFPKKVAMFKKVPPKPTELKKLVDITQDILQDFEPKVLEQDRISPLLSFLARLAVFKDIPVGRNKNVSEAIAVSEFIIGKDTLQVGKKFVKAISVGSWGEICDKNLMDEILRLNSELVVHHNLHGEESMQSVAKLEHQAKQERMAFGGKATYEEYEVAIDEIKEGRATLYKYQMTIFVEGHSQQECEETASHVEKLLNRHGIEPLKADIALKWLWLSMLPSNEAQVYPAKLLSTVLSHWITCSGEAKGHTKSDWGEGCLRWFKTANKDVYPLNLHVSSKEQATAHTLTVAPTESGKTTLWEHIIAGTLRLDVICYIFDRLKGARIFTESVGGTYVMPENILNPLLVDDMDFLCRLFLMMAECSDDVSKEQANQAVKNILALPKPMRVLTNIIDECFPQGKLKRGLNAWTGNNVYSKWFNGVDANGNAYDALDLANNHLVSFDMTDIQENPLVAACAQYYIIHKIRSELNREAKPHLIFIDETSPQLQNAEFREYVKTMLKEYRKLRGSINLCFQNAKSVFEHDMGDVIVEQCKTKFFLPSYEAELENYEGFNLNAYEKAYIKEELPIFDTLKRSVLVKRKNESVILDIDMSGMGRLFNLYKSGKKHVKLAEDLKEQFGHVKWVDEYLVRAA